MDISLSTSGLRRLQLMVISISLQLGSSFICIFKTAAPPFQLHYIFSAIIYQAWCYQVADFARQVANIVSRKR